MAAVRQVWERSTDSWWPWVYTAVSCVMAVLLSRSGSAPGPPGAWVRGCAGRTGTPEGGGARARHGGRGRRGTDVPVHGTVGDPLE
ncbi:hypothetical protein GCM10018793_54010 [Streptomyces sulfonofaciens]|uniref:Uncharacterized protein n=1 Tax=Streptomyces sulfonofaciens TaxID=68272 RepID=A0A919L6V3_9ACTN|nr:hypothetical protein GCM10018793_54010 [Streptomyces sulfonofaciens]